MNIECVESASIICFEMVQEVRARWETFRGGLDLKKIEDMVYFFQKLFIESKNDPGSRRAVQQPPIVN